MCCRYKERAAVGVTLLVLSYPLLSLHDLAGAEVLLLKPFPLRPDYEITYAWYLKFLGTNLSLLCATWGSYFFIPYREFQYRLAAKVAGFYADLQLVLFLTSFNRFPCQYALGLYLLTLTVLVMYCKGFFKWMPRMYYRLFPKDEAELNQITHP